MDISAYYNFDKETLLEKISILDTYFENVALVFDSGFPGDELPEELEEEYQDAIKEIEERIALRTVCRMMLLEKYHTFVR